MRGETPIRRAGRCRLATGDELIWSVAEGARGRRWRAIVSHQGAMAQNLLLEVSPSGRPRRLELATTAGMLTLHPEPDERTIHGNVVGSNGVRPLAFEWSPGHELVVPGLPVATVSTIGRLSSQMQAGASRQLPILMIGAGLDVEPSEATIERLDERRWRLGLLDGQEEVLSLDPSGLPTGSGCEAWPLEAE